MGLPFALPETNRSGFMPPEIFPLENDPIPKGYSGWLLFFDEMSSAPISVQAAAYKIILDREVGKFKLHSNVRIICAGNLTTDKAIVNKLSTAMQSRLLHMTLTVNPELWLDWADEHNIDYRIKAWIRFNPKALHQFEPKKHHDLTFPCPRTWEFLSDLLKDIPVISLEFLPLFAGTIGEGQANEFLSFTNIYKELPTIDDIKTQPDIAKVPTEPSAMYAVTELITHHFDKTTAKDIIRYVVRLPPEFQMISLMNKIKREKTLAKIPEIQNWILKYATELL